jgi:hypothetical protein
MANRAQAIKSVKKRIVPVEEAEPYLRVLLYGRNKQGKTRTAVAAPNPLIIDINEHGTRSVRSYKGAKVFHVNKWEDITWAYWMLREGDHDYQTVVLDTVTAMQHLCMRHVLGSQEDRDPNREPSMPDRRSWGKLGELMKPIFLEFRNLPMHVVFVAQERRIEDEDEATVEHTPDLSPSVRGVLTGAVDIIGRVYQAQVRTVPKGKKKEEKTWETRMLVGPHDEFVTGDRTGALGRIVRKPSVNKMIELGAFAPEEEE